MEPIDYGGALRRSWRLLLALAILGAVIAVLLPSPHAKKQKSALPYQAVAIVGSPPTGNGSPLNGAVSSAQIQFEANSAASLQTVADAAGLAVPAPELPAYLSATVVPTAGATPGQKVTRNAPTTVHLVARGATESDAVSLVNTYATTLQTIVNDAVSAKRPGAQSGYEIISAATSATRSGKGKTSLGSSRKVRGAAGLVIGLVLGAAVVLLRELLDKRLRNASRAEANFGFPVVAEIPSASGAAAALPGMTPMVDVLRDPDSPGAEAYRMLRMSVMFEGLAALTGPTDPYALGFESGKGNLVSGGEPAVADVGPLKEIGPRQVILVVSPGTEPSRPYVAANLAATYAEAGERVVIMSTGELDAKGSRTRPAEVPGEIRTEDVQAHLEPSRLEHVSRLPLSVFVSRSGQLVTRVPAILEAARPLSDVIIIEAPPLLAVHHAEALVHSADVVLVVAECRYTTFDHARRGGELLRRMGAPVLGVVLTGVRLDRTGLSAAALPGPSGEPPAEGEHPGDGGEQVAIAAGVGTSPGSPPGPTDT